MDNYYQLKDTYEELSSFKPFESISKNSLDFIDDGFEDPKQSLRPAKIIIQETPDMDYAWLGEQFKQLKVSKRELD